MASDSFRTTAQAAAREFGAIVWEGLPLGGPWTQWRGDDVANYVATLAPLKPSIVYVDPEDDALAVAVAGVLHIYGGSLLAQRLEPDDEIELVDVSNHFGRLARPSHGVQETAGRIAEDPRFDGYDNLLVDQLIEEAGVEPASQDFEQIRSEALTLYFEGPYRALERQARTLARRVLEHPDFDPLLVAWDGLTQDDSVRDVIVSHDPRLERLVQTTVFQAVTQKGLRDAAEIEFKKIIGQLMRSIPRLVLDQVGFSSRKVSRDELLEPHLSSIPDRRKTLASYWIKRLEEEHGRSSRETRYAAAALILLQQGLTKKAVSTRLHLSPSTTERLIARSLPSDFQLEPNDPIVLELAPELRDPTRSI
jgi:hypothetical protein